jgi:hypothetical protein
MTCRTPQGAYLWYWKDSIDRAFMRKYSDDLPDKMAMMAKMAQGTLLAQHSCSVFAGVLLGCSHCRLRPRDSFTQWRWLNPRFKEQIVFAWQSVAIVLELPW